MNKLRVYIVGFYSVANMPYYLGVFRSLDSARKLFRSLSDANLNNPFLICSCLL